jgi:UDP-glucose 4-epimerase
LNILTTGGAGYIGSHTVLELLQTGHRVVVLDNFCTSSPIALQRVAQITGQAPLLIEGDLRDRDQLDRLFAEYPIDAVLHFAGLKAVAESVQNPWSYYDNNIGGSLALLQAMAKAGVWQLVFSSSATVYGEPAQIPISEDCPTGKPTNPYGRSKLMVEEMLRDLANADPRWAIALLRYFNPVGAHDSGQIGEDPHGIPNNLLPCIHRVAAGKIRNLSIYGNNYPTRDGTCIRDYLHVMDLASGHLKALDFIHDHAGIQVWNLGTGVGYTVLEMVRAFEQISGVLLPIEIVARRAGDIAECWADPTKAVQELGWKAERGLEVMMRDAWRWQITCPNGYQTLGGA